MDMKAISSSEISKASVSENKSFDPDKKIDVNQKRDTKESSGYDVDKRVTVTDNIGTTSEERIKFASYSKGQRSGEPGNSSFTPDLPESRERLSEYGQDYIDYKDGNPDFSSCSAEIVKIENMSSDRSSNFKQADAVCAEKWNVEARNDRTDWTDKEVKEWRTEQGYSWHECIDMKTMNLVPREIHDECKHYGGVAECKRFEAIADIGGEFDE